LVRNSRFMHCELGCRYPKCSGQETRIHTKRDALLSEAVSALGLIAGMGGAGAFIDFCLGKKGQKVVRDWLEVQWIKVSDVNLGNIGQKEAIWTINYLRKTLGHSFFSLRRAVICLMIALLVWVIGVMTPVMIHTKWQLSDEYGTIGILDGTPLSTLLYLLIWLYQRYPSLCLYHYPY
jgi:hypothetical protein